MPQALIVIYLQKHINARIAERVKALHLATNRIVAEDIKEAEQGILSDFDTVYEARRRIYLFKQSSKFALNAINGRRGGSPTSSRGPICWSSMNSAIYPLPKAADNYCSISSAGSTSEPR